MESRKKYDGVLLVDKPIGITSHDVVHKIRQILHQKEVGHTGTLDPLATGLLAICLGKATKIAQFLTSETKSYGAEIRLGMSTPTYDAEGIDSHESPLPIQEYSELYVTKVLASFLGTTAQEVPPHSAVHVGGKRLYELTRQGKTVELPERQIEILGIELTEFSSPVVKFNVTCSSGTYVRSLANDIGKRLGCGAYLSGLRRSAVGAFRIEQAITLQALEQAAENGAVETLLLPISEALRFASITLNANSSHMIGFGRAPQWSDIATIDGSFDRGEKLLAKDSTGRPLAIVIAGATSSDYKSCTGHPVESFVRVFA